ncbi:MAG TPA: hypothetical protein VM911_03090 [Pyrinomonadaceae bacterium]|jgi:hypothetical protein|nr:hypothetical protein [Pyrinomonadaceae bacterium]
MMRRTLLIICLALLVACPPLSINTSRAAVLQAQSPADNIASIEAYSKQMDAYTKRNARAGRLFGDTRAYETGDEPARWQEFKTKRALQRAEVYSAATAWTGSTGEPVVVNIDLTSPSGDWAQFNSYYYRSDGTLAKLRAEMRTFLGDVIIIRDRFYDSKSKLLQEKTRYLDLQTRKPKKIKEGDFMDMPPEVYAKTSTLPFYALLKKRQ